MEPRAQEKTLPGLDGAWAGGRQVPDGGLSRVLLLDLGPVSWPRRFYFCSQTSLKLAGFLAPEQASVCTWGSGMVLTG